MFVCVFVGLFVCWFVCLSVNFFLSKISQQLLDFRALKFSIKLDSDKLYCVAKKKNKTKNSHILLNSPFICSFFSLQWKFPSQISQLLLEPVFSNFVYTFR